MIPKPDTRLAIAGVVLLVVIGLVLILPPKPEVQFPTVQNANQSITLAAVSAHNTATDCWTVIDGTVYGVTNYIASHPGGREEILKACGADATALFETQDGEGTHSNTAWDLLSGFAIGKLTTDVAPEPIVPQPTPAQNTTVKNTTTPKPKPIPKPIPQPEPVMGVTFAQLAKHNSSNDCWINVRDGVYDVTKFIPMHPGGRRAIANVCGTNATKAFESQGGRGSHSRRAWSLLETYRIDTLAKGG